MANEPITQRISTDLRRQIHEGKLGPGALLPSETELAREYNVSRQTARSALQALEHEGLVVVRPRRGPSSAATSDCAGTCPSSSDPTTPT